MAMHRWIPLALLMVSFCALSTQSSAQEASSQEGVIRINVNLVQVDAIVTDAKGKPVTDLTADDFIVLQDGKPQTISNFTFVALKNNREPAPRPAITPKQAKNAVPPPPMPVGQIRPDQVRRTVALVVDDLALSADSTVRVRQALKKWVDEEMQPGDLVAILRTSAGMGALQQFTADKRGLYAAIDLVQFHTGRVGVSSFAPLTGATLTTSIQTSAGTVGSSEIDTTLFDNEIQQSYMLGSIGAIRYVLQGLRDLPGRKSLVLFSENMRFTYLEGPGLVNTEVTSRGVVEERLERLIDDANRSSVVIYAIDPRGVVYTGLTAEDFTGAAGGNSGGLAATDVGQVDSQRNEDLIASRDGMVALTEKTGGLFLHNNDIQGSLKEVVDDGNGYYLLGYHPDASTFDVKTRQTKFHTISVRVKRPGLHVRSRTGFFGTPDAEAAPAPVGRVAQISQALASPFASSSMRVQLTTLFAHSDKQGSYINALFHFDAHDLEFHQVNGGSRQAQFDTFAVTFDVDGGAVSSADKTWNLRVEDDQYDELLRRGMVYSMHVPVKKPGSYQMRMVLRDSTSEKVASATQFIEVPDIGKGRLALSGLVLAGEQQQQAGATDQEGAINTGDPNLTTAVRVFKQQTPIIYALQIMNARPDSNKKFQLEIQTRLFREGQLVYSGTPSLLNVESQKDPKHLVAGGRLQLAQATPGRYALQVIVTDKLAKEKYRIAAQSMDFEIRE
jgi:VWFA-related protein